MPPTTYDRRTSKQLTPIPTRDEYNDAWKGTGNNMMKGEQPARVVDPMPTVITGQAAPGYSGTIAEVGDTGEWEVPALPSGDNSGIQRGGYAGVDAGEVSTLYSRVTGLDGGGTGSVNPLVPAKDAAQMRMLQQVEQMAQEFAKPRPTAKMSDNKYVGDVERYRDQMGSVDGMYRAGGYTGSLADRGRIAAGMFGGTFAEMMGANNVGKALVGMVDPNAAYERGKDSATAGLTSSLKLADMAAEYEFNKDKNSRSNDANSLKALQWAYEQQYPDANASLQSATTMAQQDVISKRQRDTNLTSLAGNLIRTGSAESIAAMRDRLARDVEAGRMTRAQAENEIKRAELKVRQQNANSRTALLPSEIARNEATATDTTTRAKLRPADTEIRKGKLELDRERLGLGAAKEFLGLQLNPETRESFTGMLEGTPAKSGWFSDTPAVPPNPAAVRLRNAANGTQLTPVGGGGSQVQAPANPVDNEVFTAARAGDFARAISLVSSSNYDEATKQQLIATIEGLRKSRNQGR